MKKNTTIYNAFFIVACPFLFNQAELSGCALPQDISIIALASDMPNADFYANKVATDNTPPTVTSYSPMKYVSNVPTNTYIQITFSEPVQKGIGNITLKVNASVSQTINVTGDNVIIAGNVVTIDPDNFSPGVVVGVEVASGAFLDMANNIFTGIGPIAGWQFTIGNSASSIMDNAFEEQFVVFPNPSSGIFEVETNKFQNAEIIITNLQGQLVYQERINNIEKSLHTIDISKNKGGIYILNISDENGFKNRQLSLIK